MDDKMKNNAGEDHKLAAHCSTGRRWLLLVYDLLIYTLASVLLLLLYDSLPFLAVLPILLCGGVFLLIMRALFGVYRQIWRYGNMPAYVRLLGADLCSSLLYFLCVFLFPSTPHIGFTRALSIVSLTLLGAMLMRIVYYCVYRYGSSPTALGKCMRVLALVATGSHIKVDEQTCVNASAKIKIAIIGAGRVGVSLAEELLMNPKAAYKPCCFVEVNPEKIGRRVLNIPVVSDAEATKTLFDYYGIQEVVVALPELPIEKKTQIYKTYRDMGYKLKNYDYPIMQTAGKRQMREFDVEDLLFRRAVDFTDEKAACYYRGKTVLITGGGGSIGSELCRQIAKFQPEKLIALDVYENGAYDVQQELRLSAEGVTDLQVEIVSVCDRRGLESVFATYRPQIVLHAAAHKHVPLMEHNCVEAVKNNVFGTLNVVELAEQYQAEHLIMVSTDKAVNPTNVMGATKRMCEMIVQSHSRSGTQTKYSATRFGNVLGSAGSVIPLFRRQISKGGPVTLTDFRIVRYFMTIPEASQLVLQSGSIAKNGELFVLDMGKPVKILELAENMIRLSGYEPYRDIPIVETGLRPGEKLYEELLIRTESLDKTENGMIFIERDQPITLEELKEKLDALREAIATEDDDVVREALRRVVPTFRTPSEVNAAAESVKEMQEANARG